MIFRSLMQRLLWMHCSMKCKFFVNSEKIIKAELQNVLTFCGFSIIILW